MAKYHTSFKIKKRRRVNEICAKMRAGKEHPTTLRDTMHKPPLERREGMTDNIRPSESTHYYRIDGTPVYTVIGKNGKERPTTLRDLKKMGDLVPSVTSIIKLAARPMLQQWIIDQHILACLTTERYENESEEAYIARIKADAN